MHTGPGTYNHTTVSTNPALNISAHIQDYCMLHTAVFTRAYTEISVPKEASCFNYGKQGHFAFFPPPLLFHVGNKISISSVCIV